MSSPLENPFFDLPEQVEKTEDFDIEKAKEKLGAKYNLQFVDTYTSPDIWEQSKIEKVLKNERKKEDIKNSIRDLVTFLKLPLVIDSFNNDDPSVASRSRRAMRTEIDQTYGQQYMNILEENKLRGNKVAIALSHLYYCKKHLGLTQELGDTTGFLREKFSDKYNELNLEQKKEYVKEVDKAIIDFLRLIARKSENMP